MTLTVTDSDGGVATDTLVVTVNNAAPVVTAGPDATVNEGSAFASSGSFTDPGSDAWTATVDYGDGTGAQALALNSDKTFALNHTYADNGTYTVTVTVRDDDGGTGSDTATVTVRNVAPVVDAGPDQTVTQGTAITVSGTFTDVGSRDTHTASINWGDGNVEAGTVTESGGNGTVSRSHTYAAAGQYTVTVTVTDDDGGSGTDTLRATVNTATARVCDVNRDGSVNILDINLITAARNQRTTSGDPRDSDGDGVITVLDARKCVLSCDKPNCAQ